MFPRCLTTFLTLITLSLTAHAADPKREALWAAVRAGDAKAIEAAIKDGADVNAKNEYGVSALWIAIGKNPEIIELLLKNGADVNARDDIWYQTPLSSAMARLQLPTVKLLIKAGAKDTDAAFYSAASTGNEKMMEAILELAKISQDTLDAALYSQSTGTNQKVKDLLIKAGAKPIPPASEADKKAWTKIVGTYDSDGGQKINITMKDVGLVTGGRWLKPTGKDEFMPLGSEGSLVRVTWKDGEVAKITMKRFTAEYGFYKFKEPVAKPNAPVVIAKGTTAPPANWPSFRGPNGTGVVEGQNPPVEFDGKSMKNVNWKTEIPGLGHSCPVVWGNRIFITTAISSREKDPKIRIGNYGDVASVNDTSSHTYQVFCLDRDTGRIIWKQTAHEGVPKIKRHLKGSQANCTVATDGLHVIACFGPEGLYCYDFEGKLRWKRDLSTLDSSFALDKEYEWGFGNSPVLHDDLCILQCDLSRDSFLAAFRLDDGSKVWSTPRDEIPSWSSPVIWKNSKRTEIVTNAAQYARGYDPTTGAELWRFAKKSEVTVPTPVLGDDLAYVSSGNRPIQPIAAIKPGASGDISLKPNETTNSAVAWSTLRGGPYMPTPIFYKGYFYTCSNSGILACYDAATGKEVYKERMGGTSYTASPVASDGRIYFASEQGEIRVVKAGPEFELLATNALDDFIMATPAISNGALIVRSQHYVWSLVQK